MSRRDSLSPSNSTHEFKQRVLICLNKLSDRDTLLLASSELYSIARSLTHDSFSPFLSCIHSTDASDKSNVRKHCMKVLSIMAEAHGDDLSVHLPRMISTVVKRLKDSDSAVRSACVEAVSSMSLHVKKQTLSIFVKPFLEVMSVEQDYSSQIGSALCLAAAVEAAADPEPAQLGKILPRLVKLVKSECFKAKPALLGLMGSVVVVTCAPGGKGVYQSLLTCGVEFLSSDDWLARKAAAEMLGKLAALEVDLAKEHKVSCLATLESRRFDKVKAVREAMNKCLELWKEVDGMNEEVSVSPSSQSKSASRDNGSCGCSPPTSGSPMDVESAIPQSKRTSISRSPPSSNALPLSTEKLGRRKNNEKKSNVALSRTLSSNSDCKLEVVTPHNPSKKLGCDEDNRTREPKVVESTEGGNTGVSRPVTMHNYLKNVQDHKTHRFGAVMSRPRVFPLAEEDEPNHGFNGTLTDEVFDDHNDIEDLSLIRQQLVQIENQQSNLLNLLQRYMGSSQNGMNSLASRVQGLEMALDEISHDLAITTGRTFNNDTCCKLPGTEFLSPKFWKRTEGRCSASRSYCSGNVQSPMSTSRLPDKDASTETYQVENHRLWTQNKGEFANSSEHTRNDMRGNLDFTNRSRRNFNVAAASPSSHSQGWGT